MLTLATAQLSEVIGVPSATLVIEQLPPWELVTTLAGQEIVGGSVSMIVTVWEQELVLPLVSVTVQCTVVLPTVNCGGASLVTLATLQLSPVIGVPSGQWGEAVALHYLRRVAALPERVVRLLAGVLAGAPRAATPRPQYGECSPADIELHDVRSNGARGMGRAGFEPATYGL